MSEKSEMLRHFLASIAYHASKALNCAPINYPELDIGKGVRTPKHILHHITGVLSYTHSFYEQYDTTYFEHKPWDDEKIAFYDVLLKLDKAFKEKSPRGATEEQLLQGPLSDSMAHIGQLLLLRRLAGSSVPSENFLLADIRKGVLGYNQPEPLAPDE
jgi:hypothetical protein